MEKYGYETREHMFNEVKAFFEKSANIFITNFSNLKVPELQELRTSLKNISSRYIVVKNTIAQRALKELEMEEVVGMIDGMCGMVFVGEDPIATSRALVDFKKEHATLDIKGGFLDGAVVSFDKIKELAALPPKEILLSMVVSSIYSPVTGFVNSLAGIIRKFVYVINAIKEKQRGQMKPGLRDPDYKSGERKSDG